MDVITETSLEALLQRATDGRNKNTDTAAIDAICAIIKKEPEAPAIATKLIAAKIQSSDERESLQGLLVLDNCMKSCGSGFHSEIGKFRFLNEMIKLVSPKFLGPRTSPSVKSQVLQMMHDWTISYPKEYKIKEAYDMLIKQGVICKNAVESDISLKSCTTQLTHQKKGSILYHNEEKVKVLQKLLQSKNPDDIQAANRLIKTMVKEDEKRVEIKCKRLSEVEHVRNNVRLLGEMLDSFIPHTSSIEELELINELHHSCEKLKPSVISLASDIQDNDDFLGQVLLVGDELNQVLDKYRAIINAEGGASQDPSPRTIKLKEVSSLLDLSTPTEDMVQPLSTANGKAINTTLEPSLWENHSGGASPKKHDMLNTLDVVFSSLSTEESNDFGFSFSQVNSAESSSSSSAPAPVAKDNNLGKSKKVTALEELNMLGKTLLEKYKVQAFPINSMEESKESVSKIESESENDMTDAIIAESASKLEDARKEVKKEDFKSLLDVFVSLESVKPSSLPPITVIEEKNGVSVTIHVGKDSPKEHVTVFVVTTLSKNPYPLTNYLFQAVVPKDCRLKLQPPSGSELPAYNPFMPPSAITQIMLVANPRNVRVALKCMISYTVEKETFTEMGEVDELISVT